MNTSHQAVHHSSPTPQIHQEALTQAEQLYQRAQLGLQPAATLEERQQAVQDLQATAQIGHIDSIVQLAQIYADGMITTRNLSISLHFWLKAAELGDIRAQLRVAEQYAQGIEVQRNIQQASLWYGKAAAQGNIEAKMQLTQLDWSDQLNTPPRYQRSTLRNMGYAVLGFLLIVSAAIIFA